MKSCLPLTGDVSPRKYFRIETTSAVGYIVSYYPIALRPVCLLYTLTTEVLEGGRVRVPRIFDRDCDAGIMLLEDVGTKTLYQFENQPWKILVQHFEKAVGILQRIGDLPVSIVSPLNPILGEQRLWAEINQTIDLFLSSSLDTQDRGLAQEFYLRLNQICRILGSEELSPCHRDFMARNLVPLEAEEQLAVLDHQDLTLGPPFYDLASLLNDSLFPPQFYESSLLDRCELGPTERTSYHRAAAQRTLKALGTYHSFANRGFKQHLALVPKTLKRALHHLHRLPETSSLCTRLQSAWLPLMPEEAN